MAYPALSIIIPLYNELSALPRVWPLVHQASLALASTLDAPVEVIWVNDGSDDGSADWLALQQWPTGWRCLHLATNSGKGAALRQGVQAAQGNVVLLHDADTEYNPSDWWAVLCPLLTHQADAVFGSRFRRRQALPWRYWPYALANWGLNTLLRWCWRYHHRQRLFITDFETGMKAFTRQTALSLPWQADDFAVEPEITLALLHGGHRLVEVPIQYQPRSVAQGKKIGLHDAVVAAQWVMCLPRPQSTATGPSHPSPAL
jgi:glycosyltransferase involved in cell wall biosynthesis